VVRLDLSFHAHLAMFNALRGPLFDVVITPRVGQVDNETHLMLHNQSWR